MAVLKCKMCGGDIILSEDKTFGTCDSCGSTMTFPKISDEHKLNLYNRANHFRRQNEFDKAIAAYDKILDQDDTDAEAHWGAVLSRYGIEYVEDPVSHERIPTCHRVQAASILSDPDYLSALEYAPDTVSRALYEQEARRIAEIQKGILAISSQEKPYDVFICYKETDEEGRRTRDSALAQEIYYQLTNEGYKVFFSRITLEDKLGQEYEPYIFAALNSAKVMLVIGTKPEFFNAVWVKNEWSRYLALMKNDRSRLLIPCYRDMDPYDLPEELSALQSQDMSKIGFIQDITRGIKKVLVKPEAKAQPVAVQQAPAAAANVENLMKRVRLFMEDGDFSSANEYLDKVLDEDAEYAPAYAAKVCVAFGIRKETDLAETTFQYEDNPDWQKALRFADAKQKAVYEGYSAKVKERVTRQIRDCAYDCAIEMAVLPGADRGKLDAELAAYRASCTRSAGKRADGSRRADSRMKEDAFSQAVKTNEPGDVSESTLKAAAAMFTAIGDSEATERARQCKVLAEQARQKAIYLNADGMRSREQRHPSGLEEAARLFLTVPDYKDAKAKAQACVDAAEAIRSGLYDSAVSAMNAADGESSKWDTAKKKLAETELNGYRDVAQLRTKAAKRYDECVAAEQEARRQAEERQSREAEAAVAKKKRNTILGILAAVVVVAAVLVVTLVIIPGNNYRNAVALQQAGKYEEAITAFEALNDYSDSTEQIIKTKYLQAKSLQQTGKYEEAITAFEALNGYSDSVIQISETKYLQAKALQQAEKYEEAIAAFKKLNGYSDSMLQIEACRENIIERDYQTAVVLQQAGKYEQAITVFKTLGEYSDSATRIDACQNSIKERDYQTAVALQQVGKYEEAITAFAALNGYSDSDARIVICQNSINERDYQTAVVLQQAGKYEDAITAFKLLNGYKDSAVQIEICQKSIKERDYRAATSLQQAGKYEEAIIAFEALEDYSDASAQITETKYLQAKELQQAGKYDKAIEAFTALGNYSDSTTQVFETKYLQAKALSAIGDYADAITIFKEIKEYKDVNNLLKNDPNLSAAVKAAAHEEAIAPFKMVGNCVTFGHYEQDNISSNGKEPIEWLVLEVDGDKVFLISRYNLDVQPYNTTKTDVTWETCSLRAWLNRTFINAAFTASEQKAILTTTVDNSMSQGYRLEYWVGGNDTKDKVFLLSYAEAWKYFTSDNARKCKNTAYVASQNTTMSGTGHYDYWWLRSLKSYRNIACNITGGGTLNGSTVHCTTIAVRPVLWINLSSDIF